MARQYCYFNGKITTLDQVKINPYDIGLLRGYGVFDVMCTQNGKPFFLEEHWKRFQKSADELNLQIPITEKKYREIVEKLLKLNGFKKSTIRTVLTGGMSSNGFQYEPGKETMFVLIEKFQALPNEIFEKGANAITLEHNRFFPGAKITNYVCAIKNQDKKNKSKALEIIYLKDGEALEMSSSNFFIVKDKKIITPKRGILIGITRNVAIKLALRKKIKVKERDISAKEIFKADEMFLAATNKDIVPIVKIDGRKVRNGKVGEITKILMEEFREFVKNY